MTSFFDTSKNYKRSKFTPDDRSKAVTILRRHLAENAAYIPQDVLWAHKALVPELRTHDDFDTA